MVVLSEVSLTDSVFDETLRERQYRFQQILSKVLPKAAEPRLSAAMRYALFVGGKRIRPQLAYAAAQAVGGDFTCADIPACAVELIHCYSLIHDDLPAMDDDVLRRGQPTCHVAFDEATAILAGDALQTLAFELLSSSPRLSCGHRVRLEMITHLCQASGMNGMVGGQALDIAAQGSARDESSLRSMHSLKTGALISASVITGAMSSNIATAEQLEALREYAAHAGLAFQIRDDILDVESSAELSGKEQGKDARQNKPTYSSMLGLDGAKQQLDKTLAAALGALEGFPASADMLRHITLLIAKRKA